MIDHDAYEAAERQREAQLRVEAEARIDAYHLPRLMEIVETRGLAHVSQNFRAIEALFPPGFLGRHLRVHDYGTAYQRITMRRHLREAA